MMSGTVGQGVPPVHLHNSFAEIMLVVGLDDNTGLIPTHKEDDDSDLLESLYYQDYEPQVLAAVSSTTMMHFFPFPRQDQEYPQINLNEAIYDKSEDRSHVVNSRTLMRAATSKQLRTVSVNPVNISRMMSMRRSTTKKFYRSQSQAAFVNCEFPVSEEVIKTITAFCFPDNMKIHRTEVESYAHFLVLTDMSGDKTYATCVTFCRPFTVEKSDTWDYDYESLYVNLDANTDDQVSTGQYRCFIPHCCILISKFPYFSTMKDILSYMVSLIQKNQEDMYSYIKEFTHLLTLTPVPPAGQVAMEIKLHNHVPFVIYPTDKADKPVTDIPLHLVFLSFADNEILRILSAIFMEERIVFLSSSYALLTVIIESFLYFILPFRWRFTYVPVLSAKALDLLEAPGTFIMGCSVVHKVLVEQVEGLVVVNIDAGTVTINMEPNFETLQTETYCQKLANIPDIPQEAGNSFRKVCRRARVQFDLRDMQRPTCHDMADEIKIRQRRIQKLNLEISAGCLELMVNLFRCVVLELSVEHKTFKSQKVLESHDRVDRQFYEKVFKKDMFKSFLQERMKEKSDYWTEFEVKTRQFIKPVISNSNSSVMPRRRSSKNQVMLSMSADTTLEHNDFDIFRLPQKTVVKRYIGQSILQLHKSIKTCLDYQKRASYLYLRAVFHFANRDCVLAIEDIINLASIDQTLLPKPLITEILQSMSTEDREKMHNIKGYHVFSELVKEESSLGESRRNPILDHENFSIPTCDLSIQQFTKFVSLNEMTQDRDTIEQLFLALTGNPKETYVKHETFEAFCLCWQENQEKCNAVLEHRSLTDGETILKVSQLCKTDFGTGRLVLTDKRVLFMRDASKDFKEVIKLKSIQSLEKVQLHSFLSAVDAIRIHGKEGSFRFTAWLKEERNHIYLLIQEMFAGKVVSAATKDLGVIHQAAENVLLIDAIIKSGQDDSSSHHNMVETSAGCLCVFTKYMQNGYHKLSKATSEALQNKLDPNVGEPERTSIQALLYTPGEGAMLPRLWCGLVNGKVRVFDGISWILEKEFLQTKKSLSCLTAVGKRQVWVGSYGIFIIDIDTLQSNRMLNDHGEFVIDIFVSNSHTYSASLDGVILMWDVQKLTIVQRIELNLQDNETLRSIKCFEDNLWCGLWKSIYKLSLSGEVLQKIDFKIPIPNPSLSPVEMECFCMVDDGELWAGCRRDNVLAIIDTKANGNVKQIIKLQSLGISVLVMLENRVWVGTKSGHIFVIDAYSKIIQKELKAHSDAVRALCCVEHRYIMSGAGSRDGKIAVWNPHDTRTSSGRFVLAQ